MKSGRFRTASWQRDADLEIVHLDIKAENVFIAGTSGDLENTPEGEYPTLKLADFGLSKLTKAEYGWNPADIIDQGTAHYKAPEQKDKRNGVFDSNYGQQINSRANVWCIGMLMWELIHVREWPGTPNIQHRHDGHVIREIHSGKDPEYSEALRNLVRDCLMAHPDDRPPIPLLEDIIEENLRSFAEDARTQNKTIPKVVFKPSDFNDMSIGELNDGRLMDNDARDWADVTEEDVIKKLDKTIKMPVMGFHEEDKRFELHFGDENGRLPTGFRHYYWNPSNKIGERKGVKEVFGEDPDGRPSAGATASKTLPSGPESPDTVLSRHVQQDSVEQGTYANYSRRFPHGHDVLPTRGTGRFRGLSAIRAYLRDLSDGNPVPTISDLEAELQSPEFQTLAQGDGKILDVETYSDRQLAYILDVWGRKQNRTLRLGIIQPVNRDFDTAYFPYGNALRGTGPMRNVWIYNISLNIGGTLPVWAIVRPSEEGSFEVERGQEQASGDAGRQEEGGQEEGGEEAESEEDGEETESEESEGDSTKGGSETVEGEEDDGGGDGDDDSSDAGSGDQSTSQPREKRGATGEDEGREPKRAKSVQRPAPMEPAPVQARRMLPPRNRKPPERYRG
ncbi:MAG: hypothetical protein Q9227_003370 [Pyrenula ochraceoflavens]